MNAIDIADGRIIPSKITFENYNTVLYANNYLRYFGNTMKIVIFNIIAVPLSASVCAFAFAKLNFPGKNVIFALVLGTMMIPAAVVQIPLYVMYAFFGLNTTEWPLMIPALFGGGAINIFMLRQIMKGIPNEMLEAAKIDGANTFRIYWSIIMPLCKPILIYIVIGTFTAAWSDFYTPLIYLAQSPEKYTLAVAIYQDSLITGTLGSANLKMAAGTFMSLLPAIIFFFFQRNLMDGIFEGSLKG